MAEDRDDESLKPSSAKRSRMSAITRKLPRMPDPAPAFGPLGPVLGGFIDSPQRQREFEERLRDASEPPRLGRYDVLGIVGRGSVTTVLRAFDSEMGREIALRVSHADIDGRHGRRMLREARAMARIDHPNVMRTLHVDTVDRHVFLVMELLRGRTLRAWAGSTPQPSWSECVRMYVQAARGLAAIHAAGLVHRDFKPSNAIVDDEGHVRVLDFRLVFVPPTSPLLLPDDESDDDVPADSPTNPGTVLGTPAYMPLAQLRGHAPDARSDQFALCVALHEGLYGHRPYEGETIAALMLSMGSDHLRPAPSRTKVPTEVREVLLRGLSQDPDKRWDSMDALADALQELLPRRWRLWWR